MLSEGLLLLTPVPPAGDKPPLPKGGGREAAGGFRVSAGAPVESLHPRLRRRSPSLSQGRLCPAGDVGCRARRPRRAVPSRAPCSPWTAGRVVPPYGGPPSRPQATAPLAKGGRPRSGGGIPSSAGAPVESLHPRLRRRSPSLSQGRLCPAGDVGCRARRPRRAVPSRAPCSPWTAGRVVPPYGGPPSRPQESSPPCQRGEAAKRRGDSV